MIRFLANTLSSRRFSTLCQHTRHNTSYLIYVLCSIILFPSFAQSKYSLKFNCFSPHYAQQSADLVNTLNTFFAAEKHLQVRGVQLLHQGLLFSVRPLYPDVITCLWQEFKNGSLTNQITEYLNTNERIPYFPVPNASFGIFLDEEAYDKYSNGPLVYQSKF